MKRTLPQARRLFTIASAIEAESHRYRQDAFVSAPPDLANQRVPIGTEHWCEAAFCVAGWNWCLHRADAINEVIVLGGYVVCDDQEHVEGRFDAIEANELARAGREDLGLTRREAETLFHWKWTPLYPMTVPEALRAIANGTHVDYVTDMTVFDWNYAGPELAEPYEPGELA